MNNKITKTSSKYLVIIDSVKKDAKWKQLRNRVSLSAKSTKVEIDNSSIFYWFMKGKR